jgi:ceramide glucosyltransferase
MKTTLDALSVALLLMAAGSLGATLTLQWAARTRLKKRTSRRAYRPSISVLKPLCGVDEGLYENLVSFAKQRYPSYEIVFGIADPHDPALAIVQRLRAEFPEAALRLVVHGESEPAANPKVISLVHALRVARYDHVLVSDSNVRVMPDYLANLGAEMGDPEVGLVSSLIVGGGARSIGAHCENLHLNTFVLGGVCIADLGDRSCVIGKSMLMRRAELAQLGGFESLRHVLAEDYLLGLRYREAGYRVVVSCDPVRTENRQLSFSRFVSRHMRWAQLRRWCALGPFFSEPLLYATPWLAAPLLVQDSLSASELLCGIAALMLRIGSDGMLARTVTGRWPSLAALALIPLKDTVLLGVWMVALCRRSVNWRGHTLRIGPGTRLSLARGQDDGLGDRPAHAA